MMPRLQFPGLKTKSRTVSPSSAPKSAAAKGYSVNKGASNVVFMMEAPEEKIRGKVDNAVEGILYIDPKDLTQTTGNIIVNIDSLVLVQRKKDGQRLKTILEYAEERGLRDLIPP